MHTFLPFFLNLKTNEIIGDLETELKEYLLNYFNSPEAISKKSHYFQLGKKKWLLFKLEKYRKEWLYSVLILKDKYSKLPIEFRKKLKSENADLILFLDKNGNIAFINFKGAKILGYSSPFEIKGLNWFKNFIPDELKKEIQEVFFQILNKRSTAYFDYKNTIKTKNGKYLLIDWSNDVELKSGQIGTFSLGILEKKKEAVQYIKFKLKEILFENIKHPILILDKHFKVLEINPNFKVYFDFKNGEKIDKLLGETFKKHLQKLNLLERTTFNFTFQKGNKTYYFLVDAEKLLFAGKIYFLVLFYEYTQLKIFQKALSKTVEEFTFLFNNINYPVFITGTNQLILKANRSFLEIEPHPIGKPCYKIINCNFLCKENLSDKVNKINLKGKTYLLKIDKFAENDKTRFLHMLIDITEFERLQKIIYEQKQAELTAKIASGLIHDFNNILTVIKGRIELLREKLNLKNNYEIESIEKALELSEKLTSRLLFFSKKRGIIKIEYFSLQKTLREIIPLLKSICGEEINLEINYKQGNNLKVDDYIYGEKRNLEQIIFNLVLNAKEALTNYHITSKRIKIDFEKKERNVTLIFSDNGPGIPPQIQEKIFNSFFSTKKEGKGIGLGLFVVKKAVEELGGEITLRSLENKGTTFYITLPIVKCEIVTEKTKTPQLKEKIQPDNFYTNKKILIIDDQEEIVELLEETLKEKFHQIFTSYTLTEAIKIISTEKPDIIISDYILSDGKGVDILPYLNVDNSKIIFISGYQDKDFLKELPQHPNIDFLPKPFSVKDIFDKIK